MKKLNLDRFLKESVRAHINESKKKESDKKATKFNKFIFLDYHDTLVDEVGEILDNAAVNMLYDFIEDPEPCFVGVITAAGSDLRGIIEDFMQNEFYEIFEKGSNMKFKLETVKDYSDEDVPSEYELAASKGRVIKNIISNNCEDLQQCLVYFYDDKQTNIDEVSKSVDELNVSIENINIV